MINASKIAETYINTLKYHLFPIRKIMGFGTDRIFCDCTDGSCPNIGKHPRIPWSKQLGEPQMWERWPDDGFGIATGSRSGLWVLDVDPKHKGLESLEALEHKYEPLPKTILVRTGSNGLHFYFKFPGEEYRNTAGTLGLGLDTRGDGGYVVGPASLHKSGKRYAWLNGPGDTELATAPEWLLNLVRQERKPFSVLKQGEEKQGLHASQAPMSFREATFLLEEMLDADFPVTRWMRDYADEVPREVWRGLATNLCAVVLGHPKLTELAREGFEEVSSHYSKYKPSETSSVFRDSLDVAASYGPMTFEHMIRSGMPAEYRDPPNSHNLVHAARMLYRQRTNG
jgi:hypothetical protein